MKLETVMCHATLMSMLLRPEEMQHAVYSYTATAPDIQAEGFNGYMETKVTFEIKDLERFSSLYKSAYVFPSDRTKWYYTVKNNMMGLNNEQ